MVQAQGRTALVTGASRGIGAGIARALAAAGHRVAVGYRERAGAAAAVVEACAAAGGRALAVGFDQADGEAVRAAVARVERELGGVDLLVNNAAMADERPFLELTDADWERMLSVNVLGPVRCARAVLPGMLARGYGRIVNVSSVGGQRGGRNQVHYAASKAALINFTRSLSNLYCARGVTANAIAPGLIATEMSAPELATAAGREKVKHIPLGRLGTVEEVGATAAFLCSEEASYISGETFNLNGGMYRERS
jgi:acetoacetyl-CoA reductase/3-oxoacyl-[acyl-carrier protein] reductase